MYNSSLSTLTTNLVYHNPRGTFIGRCKVSLSSVAHIFRHWVDATLLSIASRLPCGSLDQNSDNNTNDDSKDGDGDCDNSDNDPDDGSVSLDMEEPRSLSKPSCDSSFRPRGYRAIVVVAVGIGVVGRG